MKRAIYLEAYEIETVARALEAHADKPTAELTVALETGRRELRRLARKFRALLEPKSEAK